MPVTMILAPETHKSITHLWHTSLISDHSPLDLVVRYLVISIFKIVWINYHSLMKVAGKEKISHIKQMQFLVGKKGLLNSNLASNKIPKPNYQSIRVISIYRNGQASSTCTRKANSLGSGRQRWISRNKTIFSYSLPNKRIIFCSILWLQLKFPEKRGGWSLLMLRF